MAKSHRSAVVTLRLTEAEQERLREQAELRNLSVSEYLRLRIGPAENKAAPNPAGTRTLPAESNRQVSSFSVARTGVQWTAAGPNQTVQGGTITVSAATR